GASGDRQGRIVPETHEAVETDRDAAAQTVTAVGPGAAVAADGLVAGERRVDDGGDRVERVIDATARAEPGRDGAGARATVASDGLVADERAVNDGQCRAARPERERILDAAPHATAAGAGVRDAAAGHVAQKRAVGDGSRPPSEILDAAAQAGTG